MNHHSPLSISQLREKRHPVRNVNIEHRERLSALERFALAFTETIGTMGFFIILFFWTIGWISWNVLAPIEMRFDPYPAFVLWLFISNMIQLMFLPLILVGQNLQSKHATARAEADYELSIRSEEEIETIIQHLENQNEIITRIAETLERQKQ